MFTLTIEDQNGQVADQFTFDHGSYVIGRLDECDVVLPSTSVSRQHARVFVQNGRCYIEDLGSANGVTVDGQRVIKQRDLGTASQIRVGDFYLYLEYKRPNQHGDQNVLSTLFISSGSEHHKLVRINDSFAGEEFSLSEQENTIGRTDENFILLSDASISRRHAVVSRVGDHYTVGDNGSSNGTRLNGKVVRSRQPLTPGDIVRFGNVEFVFAEGNQTVNPRDYVGRGRGSSNLMIYAALAVLLLVGLAIGGMVVFGLFSVKASQQSEEIASPEEILDDRIAGLLETGQNQMEHRNWDGAASSFDEILALSPAHAAALELKDQVRREKESAAMLERGEELSEQGRHADARRILLEIPEGTVAHQRAESTLSHVNKTIAYNLKSEAQRLSNDRRHQKHLEAHQKIVEALTLTPDDEEALELVKTIETQLTKRRTAFEPYQTP
ncbi:MAG: FHA domain-containing protein [Bradymonadaceae bacterium]